MQHTPPFEVSEYPVRLMLFAINSQSMPLEPNFIERRLISRGEIPGILVDVGLAGFQQGAILSAMELGIFDELADGPRTVDELAEEAGASKEVLEILLRPLIPLGYVVSDNETYRLSSAAKRSLPDEDLELIAHFLKEQIRMALDASEAVIDAPEDGIYGWEQVQSGKTGQAYQEAMRWLASDMVDSVVDSVELPETANLMLDVGGSHGLYTVRFLEKYPGLEATIIDWEIGLQAARRTLEEYPQLTERIELLELDFEQESLPEGYDFAFLGQIVHGITPEGNTELFNKLAKATTDDGMIAILDQVENPPSSSIVPFDPFNTSFTEGIASLLGFNLFLFSGGRSYDYDRINEWLSEGGFSKVDHQPLRQSPGMSLITARK